MNEPFPVRVSVAALCASLVLAWALTGCKFFGADPAPPSRTESYLFDVITNLVPRVVLSTNVVNLTNTFTKFETNTVGEIVTVTNQLVVPTYNLITLTQQVPEYVWTPKTNSVQLAQTAGTFGNIAIPGSGGLITGLITAGLLAWGKLRSTKKTSVNLAQGSEILLELIQAMPDGDKHVTAAKQMLQKTQADDGVTKNVRDILSEEVSKGDAKVSATEIQSTVSKFKS